MNSVASAPAPVVETQRLSKHYGPFGALHQLSLTVPAGSIFALLGTSGAGKTTAIKILLNLARASSGSAHILGVDSRSIGPALLAQIGYVSESQALPLRLRIGQFFDYLRGQYRTWDQDLERQLRERLRLPAALRIGELSHGMRLKMALACALPHRPRLLVLDEPLSGIDVLARDEIINEFLSRSAGTSILISSHEMDEVERFASHVAFLHEGQLLFQGSLQALRTHARGLLPPATQESAQDASLRAIFIAMASAARRQTA